MNRPAKTVSTAVENVAEPITEQIREYTDRGWCPIPVPLGEKGPVLDGWPNLRLGREDVPEYFGSGKSNVAINLGPSGLIDIDLDCPEALRLAPHFLPPTGCVFGRRSNPRSHWLYRPSESAAASNSLKRRPFVDPVFNKEDGSTDSHDRMLVELRAGNGCCTLIPPSVHPSGEQVRWDAPGCGEPPEVEPAQLEHAASRLAAAALLKRYWPGKGVRQEAAMALAGLLLRGGWNPEEAEAFVMHVATAAGDEEAEKRTATVLATNEKLNAGKPVTGGPKLSELVDPRVVKKVCEWLNLVDVTSESAAGEPEEETSDLREPNWPESPGEAAYEGFAGSIVRAIQPYTESDPIGVLLSFLVAFACAVGRGPYAMVGGTRHDPRLFIVLVGRTSKARKGDSWGSIERIFEVADPQWVTNCIQRGLSTGEGLIRKLRDPVTEEVEDKETGEIKTVVLDKGVEDKRLLVQEAEYARVLHVKQRQSNTLGDILREAWDGNKLQVMTKTSPYQATDAYFCLVGHTTRQELLHEITYTDTANGFANRNMFVAVRRGQLLPNPRPFTGEVVEQLGIELKTLLEGARSVRFMERSFEANAAWEKIYPDLSAEREGIVGSIVARGEAMVLRLSMIYALLDGCSVIQLSHLHSALEVWAYCDRSAQYIFGDATGDPVADRIVDGLRQKGAMSRTEISRLFGGHVTKQRIDDALALLVRTGTTGFTIVETNGRCKEMWRLER